MQDATNPTPLADLDEWEDDLLRRYPENKGAEQFRDYDAEARSSVKEFYRLNHRHQTLDFVRQKRAEFLPLTKRQMTVWEALEYLNTLVDDSDPDIDLPQIEHLLQTAEAIRHDGHPRWFILTGLIHDLGKSFACSTNHSGRSSAIPSRSVAHSLRKSSSTSSSPTTQTRESPSIRRPAASTKQAVASTTSPCPGDMTNTCITWSETISQTRRST